MKKIILIIFASLIFANIGFAESEHEQAETLKRLSFAHGYPVWRYSLATICVDNYKFVISKPEEGITMVQFYEERDGKSLPAKC